MSSNLIENQIQDEVCECKVDNIKAKILAVCLCVEGTVAI